MQPPGRPTVFPLVYGEPFSLQMFLPNPITIGMRKFPPGVAMYSVREVPSDRISPHM